MESTNVTRISEQVTLRDGTRLTIRAIRPSDATHLQSLHARLSPESILLRFLGRPKELPCAEAERLANVDYRTRMAIVATSAQNGEEQVVGVARYETIQSSEPGVAEAAVVVEDRYQSLGLGTILLVRLVTCAREHGIHTFVATVYSENTRILRLLQRSELPTKVVSVDGGVMEIHVKLPPQFHRVPLSFPLARATSWNLFGLLGSY